MIPEATAVPIASAARSDTGCVREINEDNYVLEWWPDGRSLLAVVADGMGGHGGGDVASRIVVETFRSLLSTPWPECADEQYEKLAACFHAADKAIRARRQDTPETMGMGATAVAAVFTRHNILHLYAGDSRLYRFCAGMPAYRTTDHSIVQVLIDAGQLAPEEVRHHPMRSVVTSCLGGGENGVLSVDPGWEGEDGERPAFLELVPGDVFLLCSDGLTSEVSDAAISQIALDHADPEILVSACVGAARSAGGRDNITVLALVVYESIPGRRDADLETCILEQSLEQASPANKFVGSPREVAKSHDSGTSWLARVWKALLGQQQPAGSREDGRNEDDF